jgi:hypothetical protein
MDKITQALNDVPVSLSAPLTNECICQGNWQRIIKEATPLLDKQFVQNSTGDIFTFCGVLHSSDDYYYVMSHRGKFNFLSCVGTIEHAGFKLLAEG